MVPFMNEPLPVLPGNEQDLGHENIVKTYLFYWDQSANAENSWHLSFRHFYLKLMSWMVTASLPNHCQIFNKNLIETTVLGRLVLVKQVNLAYVFMTKVLLIAW